MQEIFPRYARCVASFLVEVSVSLKTFPPFLDIPRALKPDERSLHALRAGY